MLLSTKAGAATGQAGHLLSVSACFKKDYYTTNPIESYHRMVRKVIKTKGSLSSEDAILKQIYLATVNCNIKWQGTMFNWIAVRNDLIAYFVDRLLNDTVI